MKAIVIGGTGFLGAALARRLQANGIAVRTFSRRLPVLGGVSHIAGDIGDSRRLREALCGVDCVFHFAWTTVPQTSNEDPLADVQANLAAGFRVLEACRDCGVGSLIFPSSGGTVYGSGHPEPLEEAAATDPICSYGITKLAYEKYIALYHRLYGLDYRILRIANAYGEGQPTDRPQGLIGVTFARSVRGEPITVWGDGTAVRDYIYVGDVADCCIAAMKPLPEGSPRVINVSTQTGYSVREIISEIELVTGIPLTIRYQPSRNCDADRVVLDNGRARHLLGWSPATSLPEGLRRTWASFPTK